MITIKDLSATQPGLLNQLRPKHYFSEGSNFQLCDDIQVDDVKSPGMVQIHFVPNVWLEVLKFKRHFQTLDSKDISQSANF